MDWLATDRHKRHWFPYIATRLDGAHELSMHPELADTDMADLTMDELAAWLGPLTITSTKES